MRKKRQKTHVDPPELSEYDRRIIGIFGNLPQPPEIPSSAVQIACDDLGQTALNERQYLALKTNWERHTESLRDYANYERCQEIKKRSRGSSHQSRTTVERGDFTTLCFSLGDLRVEIEKAAAMLKKNSNEDQAQRLTAFFVRHRREIEQLAPKLPGRIPTWTTRIVAAMATDLMQQRISQTGACKIALECLKAAANDWKKFAKKMVEPEDKFEFLLPVMIGKDTLIREMNKNRERLSDQWAFFSAREWINRSNLL
jgi:hypothetical protein